MRRRRCEQEMSVARPPHLVVVRCVGREFDPRLGRPIEDVLLSQRGDVEQLDPFHEEELGLGLEDDAREPRAERVAVLDVAQLAGGVYGLSSARRLTSFM